MNEIKKVGLVGFGSLGSMYAACFAAKMPHGQMVVIADEARTHVYRSRPTLFNGEPIAAVYKTYEEAAAEAGEEPFDLMVYSVKFGSLPQVMEQTEPLISTDTAIISVLNGIVSEEVLAEKYGWERVLLCIAQQMDALKEGFAVTCGSVGVMALGVHNADDPAQVAQLDRVCRWLESIDQPYIVPEDIQRQLWGKLMCNVGVNQSCTVFDCCVEGVTVPGQAREAMIGSMQEVRDVGRACGIGLTDEDVDYWVDIIDHLNPKCIPSLRQDVMAKRKTEVDLFSGTINRLGAKHGVPTPVNQMFYDRIKQIEAAF